MKDYRPPSEVIPDHILNIPQDAGKGLSEWIAVCSCGANWRCFYTRKGLAWQDQNEECKTCPRGG